MLKGSVFISASYIETMLKLHGVIYQKTEAGFLCYCYSSSNDCDIISFCSEGWHITDPDGKITWIKTKQDILDWLGY